MANYLLIESRDTFEHADSAAFYQVAADLAKAGNQVTFFLVQNGVLPARQGSVESPVERLHKDASSVSILADEFSLRERAITQDRLAAGVSSSPIDRLVDLLADPNTKAVWH